LVVALLGALGLAAGLALAKSTPPKPIITAGPATPTSASAASFSFVDSAAKVSFVCSLDHAAFAACTSPASYHSLSVGAHSFSVEAKDASGTTSDAATYSWTVDHSPPSIAMAFPSDGSVSNAAAWNRGCSRGIGVCGTASDPSGIARVQVSIRQNATGKYWNGVAYSSGAEAWQSATLFSPAGTSANWFYALPRPVPDGQYTLHVLATDNVGNGTPAGSPAVSTFKLDTTAPPAPAIGSKPADPTNQTSASLGFSDSEAGVSYVCRLDGASFGACSSPKSYSGLSERRHTFAVEAVDGAGNTSDTASYSWVVDTTPPPAPTIGSHPADPTTATSATFTFTDRIHGVQFQCQLDSAAWQACASPTTYNNLAGGSHAFHVRVLDDAGNASDAASFTWTIQQTSGMPFSISGSAPNPLYPGAAAQPIALKLTNPNNVTIYVTALGANLQATGASGCATNWFAISAASIPTAGIAVPANGTVTVPTANDPTIQMIESSTNQDACKGATLTLSYSGSAHS
jgi:hypothetical protein